MGFGQDFFQGRPGQNKQLSNLTPQQQQMWQQIMPMIQGGINNSFDFNKIAEGAQNRFQQNTMPSIADRFGSMDAQRSSGYGQATANAQRDLQLDLAGQQQKFGLESQRNWADILGLASQPQFENVYEEGRPAGIMSLIEQGLPLALHAGAAFATGGQSIPFSAAMYGAGGGQDFSGLMEWFKPKSNQPQQPQQPTGGAPTTTQGQMVRRGGYAGGVGRG